jgi:hypothetical protein
MYPDAAQAVKTHHVPTPYVIEESAEGRSLVATGPWSRDATAFLMEGDVDGLTLVYARGFEEPDLDFLDAWPVRRLSVLDRTLTDLAPIGRLGASLESLSIQAAPSAEIDLAAVPRLRTLAAWWSVVEGTIDQPNSLEELTVMEYDEINLRPLATQPSLMKVVVKVAPLLESMDGAEELLALAMLRIAAARELSDVTALASISSSLIEVEFESCLEIDALDDLSGLRNLRFLGVSDCGRVESLRPVAELADLEQLYAWGSTRIIDNDLSPLLHLPRLSEVRMRDRRDYRPRLSVIQEHVTRRP